MERVVSRAPTRVDLAGGSLDLWPLGILIPGSLTVNVAVSLEAVVTCTPRAEPGLHLQSDDLACGYDWVPGTEPGELALLERLCEAFGVTEGWAIRACSGSPPGAGLGGSSALGIAAATALETLVGKTLPESALVALCRDLEARNLGIPTGVQDFWPAIRGGILAIHYEPGADRVEPLESSLEELGSMMVVAFSGASRLSTLTNWDLVKRFLDGEPAARRSLAGVAEVACEMREAVLRRDWEEAGKLLKREWSFRKYLARGISTPEVEALVAAASRAGAWGGKVCGAGGGGCLLFLTPPEVRAAVIAALREAGAQVLKADPTANGRRVEVIP